ncbi:MAG: protease inhibitor I42 family protein [Candidatus Margulisiibacteriota bacterium]
MACALIACCLVSCEDATFQLSEKDHLSTVRVPLGAKIFVSLRGNPTTGFSWDLDGKLPETLLTDQPTFYESKQEGAANATLAGQSDTTVFSYIAFKPGVAVLNFSYRRAWEKKDPFKRYTVTIISR